jgi:hypothetical protein
MSKVDGVVVGMIAAAVWADWNNNHFIFIDSTTIRLNILSNILLDANTQDATLDV